MDRAVARATEPVEQFFQVSSARAPCQRLSLHSSSPRFWTRRPSSSPAIGFTLRAASCPRPRGEDGNLSPRRLANATDARLYWLLSARLYCILSARVHSLPPFTSSVSWQWCGFVGAHPTAIIFFVKVIAFLELLAATLLSSKHQLLPFSSYCSLSSASPHSAVRKYGGPASSPSAGIASSRFQGPLAATTAVITFSTSSYDRRAVYNLAPHRRAAFADGFRAISSSRLFKRDHVGSDRRVEDSSPRPRRTFNRTPE